MVSADIILQNPLGKSCATERKLHPKYKFVHMPNFPLRFGKQKDSTRTQLAQNKTCSCNDFFSPRSLI